MKMRITFALAVLSICLCSNAQLLIRPRPTNLLEPLIPIEEAINLAKEGNGKGFYQLAIRYAQGNELPKDDKVAYKMLLKACDANYANAILVEGICDEERLRSPNGHPWRLTTTYMYCEADFHGDREGSDSLTNEVAFARVMGKYEKARDLGALAATNQISALNKRLADFHEAEAKQQVRKVEQQVKEKKAEENNRRVAALLGDDARPAIMDREAKEMQRRREERRVREEEREEQRRQLEAIREELRRSREERKPTIEEKTAANSRFKVALKGIIGYEMGQKIGEDMKGGSLHIKLEKPYRYFDACDLKYVNGCLCSVSMRFLAGDKYTYKSLETETAAVRKDLEKRFGIELGEAEQYGWHFDVRCHSVEGGWISVSMTNKELQRKLYEQQKVNHEAQKKELPVFGEND